jgi:hypothetical protein
MKFSGMFLLAAFLVTIFSPVTVCISRSSCDHEQYFASVDVCGGTDHFVSAVADVPALHECPCELLPLDAAGCFEAGDTSFTPFLFSVPVERPPKA